MSGAVATSDHCPLLGNPALPDFALCPTLLQPLDRRRRSAGGAKTTRWNGRANSSTRSTSGRRGRISSGSGFSMWPSSVPICDGGARRGGGEVAARGGASAIGLAMIAIAFMTVLQSLRLGPVGSGYLCPPLVSAIYLPSSLAVGLVLRHCRGLRDDHLRRLLRDRGRLAHRLDAEAISAGRFRRRHHRGRTGARQDQRRHLVRARGRVGDQAFGVLRHRRYARSPP